MTRSEENHLKAIYHLGKSTKTVSTNAIAQQMNTKPSSVTDMMKKLAQKELINYKKYQGVHLTQSGINAALDIIRKHRLWEVFLVEKLDFAWDEVHDVAEQLEHIKSDALIDKLDAFLDFPQLDPHGDPIPGKDGKFKEVVKRLISDLSTGVQGICVGVKDSSAAFLKFLDKNNIALGETIKILEKEEFDGSFHIQIKGRKLHISNLIASNLYLSII